MNKACNYQKENGFFSIPMEENYHMNLDALKAFMPEKYKLLEELHEEIGVCSPRTALLFTMLIQGGFTSLWGLIENLRPMIIAHFIQRYATVLIMASL